MRVVVIVVVVAAVAVGVRGRSAADADGQDLRMLLLVPLTMIRGVINERSAYRDEAFSRVADSRAGAQQLVGPVRVVPWVERKQVELVDPLGVKKTEVQVVVVQGGRRRGPRAAD